MSAPCWTVLVTHGSNQCFLMHEFVIPGSGRRHRHRCDLCSPFANPRPLSIDGHAYHRKTRARRRRNR